MAPLFSICIPSRNRFETVTRTIDSILSQDFRSYEIIISDNSTFEKGNLSAWLFTLGPAAEKITLIEAERDLSMDENWERVSLGATGDYVLLVADRWRMRKGILSVLAQIVGDQEPDIFYWAGEKFGKAEARFGEDAELVPVNCTIENAHDVLENFLQFEGYKMKTVYGQAIPRAMNSGYRRELGVQARSIWGELFRPVSPDYTSATALLLLGHKCVRLGEMMYYPIGRESNFSFTTIFGLGHYREKYPGCEDWRGLKIDAVFPTVLNDIERTLKKFPSGSEWVEKINVENALKCVVWEFHFKEFNGSLLDVDQMRHDLIAFAQIQGLSSDAIARIKDYDKKNRHRLTIFRRLLRRLGIFEIVLEINNKLRYGKRKMLKQKIYENLDISIRPLTYHS